METQSLRYMNEISAALVNTPGNPGDLTTMLRHIARTAQKAFHTDACVIISFNPITGSYTGYETFIGNRRVKTELAFEKPRLTGVTQQILRDGLVLVEDVDSKPLYHNRFTRKENIRAFAGLALRTRHRQRPLGVIYLDFKEPRKFGVFDRETFQNFAVQASFLLQETWLTHNYEEAARIGQEVNHNLATVSELFQILQTYVDAVLDESHTLVLSVYQPPTHMQDIYLRQQGKTILITTPLRGACQYIIDTQQPYFIDQLSKAEQLPFEIINISGTEEKESFIYTPLTLRGLPMGVLSIQHSLSHTYGQEDQSVLQLLANYISLALHNMRLYSSLHQLNETGQLLTQLLESKHTLQATADQILNVTQADVVVLYPYEPLSKRFVNPPLVSGTLLDSSFQSMSPSRPDDIASLMLRREKPFFAKECGTLYTVLQGDIHIRQGDFQEREQLRSTAALPLQVGDDIVGVLFVNFRQPQRFEATQKLLIEGLAHYAAIGMKNAQVFGTLSLRRIQELTILQYIDRELSRTLNLKAVLNTLLRLANEQIHADEASILLYNSRIHALEIPAALGTNAESRRALVISVQETRGITRWVLEHKKPARVGNVHLDPEWRNRYIEAAAETVSELDVPLIVEGEIIGVLNFESTREHAFRQEDEDFLLTLAGQAVLAIKNAQAYEREQRLAEERQVLNDISKEITSQLDLAHVFNLILEKALGLTDSTLGSVHLYDREQNYLLMEAERGVAKEKKGMRQTLDQGIVGHVAKYRQLCNVDDVTRAPWNEIYLELFPGARSELAVPMLAGGELLGVLNVESPSPRNFSERDGRLLQGLADLAVIALQNAQTYEGEKRLVAEGKVLNDISKEITSRLDYVGVFDLILEKTLELTHSSLGALMLYDPELNELRIAARRGLGEALQNQRIRMPQGIVGYVATHKRLVNVEDVTQPPWNEIYLELFPETRSELTVPMLAGKELRGILNVESPSPGHFNKKDERLLQGLADLAVVALQNAERYQKAESDTQRFEFLYQAGRELNNITDLAQIEQAYEIIAQIAARQSQSQSMIYRYDETNTELVLKYVSPYRQTHINERIVVGEGLNGLVAREQKTLVTDDKDHLPSGATMAKQSDPDMHSYIIVPILFKDLYYGNLDLRHEEIARFHDADIHFFEGLAQQLANTIHRLETARARQESDRLARAAAEMSSIGQSAYEVTHRLGNDLGLIELYVNDIQAELEQIGVGSAFIDRKLGSILEDVRTVLAFSKDLKQELAKLSTHDEAAGEPVTLMPEELLKEAARIPSSLPNLEVLLDIDNDVAAISVFPTLVTDILNNLVTNSIQAMPQGGKLTLHAHNTGRSVAIQVSDTGVGIPESMQDNIFDLFFSTKNSSGFGLWSARRNALRNNGDLAMVSKPGQGTTFTLLLPRANDTTP